jgi:esterase
MQLTYELFGDAKQPSLIILHGFFASARNWRAVAEKLATDFHVYVLDQRNHGASFRHPVMDYSTMTEDLAQFIDQQQLSTVSLLGHSMGGKVAMWFALQHPNKVDKLIIADIAPVSYTHCFDLTINALKTLPLAELKNRKQAEEYLASAIPELSYRQFLLQNLVLENGAYRWRVDLDIFAANAPNIVGFPDVSMLEPFIGKALFIAGAESNYVQAGDFAQLFPTAKFSQLPNAGHWLHVQQPELFVTQVKNFLQPE